jgi:uncharacterized protein (TIRG00374 family)
MRKLIIPVVLLIGIVFIFVNIAEVQAVIETLKRGDWRFILLALVVQVFWMFNVTASFWSVYRALGVEESLERMFVLINAANFLNVVAPSGGMGGVAVLISEARRRNYSSARVTVAGGLVILLDYLAFLCVLSVGLLILFRRNNLNSAELIASAILLMVAIVLGTLIYLGMHSANSMGIALAWMARLVNRLLWPFIHRAYLSEERAHSFAHEASAGLYLLRQDPKRIRVPILLGLSNKLLLIVILLLSFVAFKVPFSLGTLVGGFSIGYLFYIVSPTPAGIGFVEGALTLGLHSLNVPLGEATVITLAYRGVTFWAPLLVGMIAFRWLSHGGNAEVSV